MRRSSVATMTRVAAEHDFARRYTCSTIGRPSISARGLPGNRVEANRAGMMTTTCTEDARSTVDAADAGCTTNNSTTAERPCYDLNGVDPQWPALDPHHECKTDGD